jgi:hypothetical protein
MSAERPLLYEVLTPLIYAKYVGYNIHSQGTKHGEENHIINTTKHKKKNQVVQKTCYITGRVEDTQEEQLGKFK